MVQACCFNKKALAAAASSGRTLYNDKTNTIDDICRTLNISRATLYRYIK